MLDWGLVRSGRHQVEELEESEELCFAAASSSPETSWGAGCTQCTPRQGFVRHSFAMRMGHALASTGIPGFTLNLLNRLDSTNN